MKDLSKTALNIKTSSTVAIDTKAKELISNGADVINFGVGEPDFETPLTIKNAGIEAINRGYTRYTAPSGILALKEAICYRLNEDCGVNYNSSQIVISSGAKHIVYVVLQTVINPGDEAIIPAPYWVSYSEMVKMAGGNPVLVYGDEENNFKVTAAIIEKAVTERTKCLIINNPCNPTGAVYTKRELEEIVAVCLKYDLYIISDEIYYKLIYDGLDFTSISSINGEAKKHTILINGVSKSYAMTGWRIGYVAAEPEISRLISSYLSNSTGSPVTISQYAAIEALRGDQDCAEQMKIEYEKRRNYMLDRMENIPLIYPIKPNGAFYIMMNIEALFGKKGRGVSTITSSDDFALDLLDNSKIAVVPSTGFGIEGYVRWSYATSMDNIKKGMDRLESYINDLN